MRFISAPLILAFVACGAAPAGAQSTDAATQSIFDLSRVAVVDEVARSDASEIRLPMLPDYEPLSLPAADQQEPSQHPPNPKPKHTGIAALVYSTGADFKAFPRRTSTWVILGSGLAAAGLARPIDDDVNERLQGSGPEKFFKPGKYLGSFYVQMGTAVGLYVFGRLAPRPEGKDRTNKVSHLGFDLVRALIVSQAFTQGVKYAVRRDRPNGDCCSFPSGHASATFATASVLERHLGYRGAWPTFVIASYVAASRLADEKHFLSDVLFGGALGMASGWTVVGRHGRGDYTMMPVPTRGGMMIAVTKKFSNERPSGD